MVPQVWYARKRVLTSSGWRIQTAKNRRRPAPATVRGQARPGPAGSIVPRAAMSPCCQRQLSVAPRLDSFPPFSHNSPPANRDLVPDGVLSGGGCSSVGRVLDCDSSCRGFESHQPPHPNQERSLRAPFVLCPRRTAADGIPRWDFAAYRHLPHRRVAESSRNDSVPPIFKSPTHEWWRHL